MCGNRMTLSGATAGSAAGSAPDSPDGSVAAVAAASEPAPASAPAPACGCACASPGPSKCMSKHAAHRAAFSSQPAVIEQMWCSIKGH